MLSMGEHRTLATVGVISSLAILSCALLYVRQQQERRRQRSICFSFSHGLQNRKAQESFGSVLADNSRTPFVHLSTEENGDGSSHPYGCRIRDLLEHPPTDYTFMQPGYQEPPRMEGPFVWVGRMHELQALVHVLNDETEFAVDTEQHSFRSFRGFTALVQNMSKTGPVLQDSAKHPTGLYLRLISFADFSGDGLHLDTRLYISTRTTDYLLDSIALHDSMSMLGPIFANPAICKVFHGADSDILWLQRDFHIYVVNMFDTAKACLILGKQKSSLSSLLQLYCAVTTNKAFQRADWRLRPLSKDMLQYARTDAHYLLYIAHRLCTELAQNIPDERMQESGTDVDLTFFGHRLEQAVCRSNLNCLNLYEKEGASASPITTATTLVSRYYNSHGCHLPSQFHEKFADRVTSLCEWRDSLARIEDESLGSVLSDAALAAVAIYSPLTPSLICATIAEADASPQVSEVASANKIPQCYSPSPVVQKYINDLHQIIHGSVEDPLTQSHLQQMTLKTSLDWILGKALCMFKIARTTGDDNGHRSHDEFGAKALEYKTPKSQRLGSAEKSRIQFVKKFSCKAPVYHNCRIYADDGRLLCFCDRKKLDWYVKRGLAEFVGEGPPSVRLLFEPKGRPEYEGTDFYIQSKTNQCVGCGESSHYLRYRVIPSCYRQHFPEHLKSHRSHDIVLLCVDCHEIAHKAAEKHKRQIATEYGIPLFSKVTGPEGSVGVLHDAVVSGEKVQGVSPLQLKNAAMALLRHGSTIPTQRRVELEKVLQTYYRRDNISLSDLHSVLLLSMGPQEHQRLLKKGLCNGEVATGRPLESLHPDGIWKECLSRQADCSMSLQEEEERTSMASSDGSLLKRQPKRRQHNRHKARRKESLLGHAVHGRRVVEILIEQEGDKEILNFCQQWRTVFVDAIHPAFLPLGWTISHSGRREFGDFSVFKSQEEVQ